MVLRPVVKLNCSLYLKCWLSWDLRSSGKPIEDGVGGNSAEKEEGNAKLVSGDGCKLIDESQNIWRKTTHAEQNLLSVHL